MTSKELKGYLSLLKDDEQIYIDLGGRKSELLSILYDGDRLYLSGDNYGIDNETETRSSITYYVHELLKDKEK